MKNGDVVKVKLLGKLVECFIIEITKKHAKVQFEEAQWIITIDKIEK